MPHYAFSPLAAHHRDVHPAATTIGLPQIHQQQRRPSHSSYASRPLLTQQVASNSSSSNAYSSAKVPTPGHAQQAYAPHVPHGGAPPRTQSRRPSIVTTAGTAPYPGEFRPDLIHPPLTRAIRESPASSAVGSVYSEVNGPETMLIEGVNYFKIDEFVKIRKYNHKTGKYSDWSLGQVDRPVLGTSGYAGNERRYVVRTLNLETGADMEVTVAPFLHEIVPLKEKDINTGRSTYPLVYAQIHFPSNNLAQRPDLGHHVWTPASVLEQRQGGDQLLIVRLLQGHAASTIVGGVRYIVPYGTGSVQALKRLRHHVEGDGKDASGMKDRARKMSVSQQRRSSRA